VPGGDLPSRAASGGEGPVARRPSRRRTSPSAGALPVAVAGDSLERLEREIVACRACPRLVAWRERVGREKRPAFAEWDYWARPVPGFGDPDPWLFVVGLAPAAHGANRTGRIFTGDRSGDFLYAALHRAGLASQPVSRHRGDGLTLTGCRVASGVRCAPPRNRPTPAERDRCLPYLARELALCPNARVVLALGAWAWGAVLRVLGAPRPWPRFAHGAETAAGGRILLGSYHVSQQNTFTGRLTADMMDEILARARALAAEARPAERTRRPYR
jgi:uracil-DNA glycosylase family 4